MKYPAVSWNSVLTGTVVCFVIPAFTLGSLFADEPPARDNNSEPRSTPSAKAASAAANIKKLWDLEVNPLFVARCVECHNDKDESGKLKLLQPAHVLKGGLRGPSIDINHPKQSLLLKVLEPTFEPHMPPKKQLDAAEIEVVRRWVNAVSEAASEGEVWHDPLKEAKRKAALAEANEADWPPTGVSAHLMIDMAIESRWQEAGIQPASPADDRTFARRIHLDLVGRIPTSQELRQFLESTDSRKREQLIDRLLETDEHARYLAEVFDTILMGRTPRQVERPRRRNRADNFSRQNSGWMEYLTWSFRTNRPWDQITRELVLGRPNGKEAQPAAWYLYERREQFQVIAEAVSQGIFGVQIQCAQCHNHPVSPEIEQRHYWGLVAFFNRTQNVATTEGPRVGEKAVGGFSQFADLQGQASPNLLVYLQRDEVKEDRPADGNERKDADDLYRTAGQESDPKVPLFSRRDEFVQKVMTDHPLVAKAMVNRLWALLMGRGIVHPVDKIDSAHLPSHPRLFEWLAKDFAASGYNVRRMLRNIACSRAYQLESSSESTLDPALFAVAVPKPLTAESLYRSILSAAAPVDNTIWETQERRNEVVQLFPEVLPEENIATPAQALWLTNGTQINTLLQTENSNAVRELLAISDDRQLVEQAFQRVLGRLPADDEADRSLDFLEKRNDRRKQGVEQLLWALLTSAEMSFNY